MTLQADLTSLADRLGRVAACFDERLRGKRPAGRERAKVGACRSAYENLCDLFTHDVTGPGMREFVEQDTRETWKYFTAEIDFESLRHFAWYKRYSMAAWRVFAAMAYRLSPPRRIVFAIACFSSLFGFLGIEIVGTPQGFQLVHSGAVWWLLSLCLFAFLLLMELREKLSLKGDLEVARHIQFGLVPAPRFQRGEVRIHSHLRPANTVGGDYYDIIDLDGDRIGLVVGDVAGKGMPAALLMALLQGSLRTLITAGLRGDAVLSKLNEYLCRSIPANSFVTLIYGELDTASGELRYVNAGHNAPFLVREGGAMDRLPSTSIALGVAERSMFHEAGIRMGPGDRLLLFTDGVTEAFNEHEEEYGEARLEMFLRNRADQDPETLIKGIVDEVVAFCRTLRPHDDMTLMLVTRESPR